MSGAPANLLALHSIVSPLPKRRYIARHTRFCRPQREGQCSRACFFAHNEAVIGDWRERSQVSVDAAAQQCGPTHRFLSTLTGQYRSLTTLFGLPGSRRSPGAKANRFSGVIDRCPVHRRVTQRQEQRRRSRSSTENQPVFSRRLLSRRGDALRDASRAPAEPHRPGRPQ